MSLCWPWVFPVAGNSRCWGPSEVVSIQHSIDLAAGPKPLDQRRGQKESLLMTNNSLFNSASVFVLFYVQLCCYWWWVFFSLLPPSFREKRGTSLIQFRKQQVWLLPKSPSKKPTAGLWSRGLEAQHGEAGSVLTRVCRRGLPALPPLNAWMVVRQSGFNPQPPSRELSWPQTTVCCRETDIACRYPEHLPHCGVNSGSSHRGRFCDTVDWIWPEKE